MMQIKDRIKNFRRIKASKLNRNPQNWRIHPETQKSALRAVLKEIGFAAACLVRDCGDGTFELIDGHLRADIAEDTKVPCLILDVSKSEADQLLATFDHITTLARTDQTTLDTLVQSIVQDSGEMQTLVKSLSSPPVDLPETCEGKDESHLLTDTFCVLIDCKDESEQLELLQRFKSEGLQCRAWIS